MFDKLQNIVATLRQAASSAVTWLSGKKRWIAITAGLVAKVLPEHTFGHQAGEFIKVNADVIFEVVGGIAIAEKLTQKAKEKLPSGIRKSDAGKIESE